MSAVMDLPTEILCAIFELSATAADAATPPLSPALTAQVRVTSGIPIPTPSTTIIAHRDLCTLPSLKKFTLHCIALSHVCARWRDVAVDFQSLWTRLHIGGNALKNDPTVKKMTALFLARSDPLPLSLDIHIDAPDFKLPPTGIHRAHPLCDHVGRCRSLRLAGNDLLIMDIMDVFVEYNQKSLSSPLEPKYSPLSALHLTQLSHVEGTTTFPSDLSFAFPHLASLRVEGAAVAAYPRWHLRDAVLADTYLPYTAHFALVMKSATRRLVLHRVRVPSCAPYVHRLLEPRAPSVRALVLSELVCAGPAAQHADVFANFFALSLFHNLTALELAGLDEKVVRGLMMMLRGNPLLVFAELRTLTLRRLVLCQEIVLLMMNSFPAVGELVLEEAEGAGMLVYAVWKGDGGVWPQLDELMLDGVVMKRRDV